MRKQALWPEHAAFMEGLVAERFVLLGGPVGGGEEAPEVLLVIDTSGVDAVRTRLAADPWSRTGLLEVSRVEPWTILLDGRSA
jgi:uncharacterized protein YciI